MPARAIGFVLGVALLGATPVAAAAEPARPDPQPRARIIEGNCVPPAELRRYHSTHQRGAPYDVLGTEGTLPEALRARELLDGLGIWRLWAREFGTLPLPNLTPRGTVLRGPYQLVVAPADEFPPHVGGGYAPYCVGAPGDPDRRRAGIIVLKDDRDAQLPGDLAHELFHAFANGFRGRIAFPSWWEEATAAWGEHLAIGGLPERTSVEDASFLGHPEIPLDRFEPDGSRTERIHPYGARRFIDYMQWQLEAFQGRRIWSFLLPTLTVTAGEDPVTPAVAAQFDALPHPSSEPGLGYYLRSFWTLSLYGRGDARAPPAENLGSVGAGRDLYWSATVEPLAAAVSRFGVDGSVRGFDFQTPALDPGGGYVLDGRFLIDGVYNHFVSNSPSPAESAPPRRCTWTFSHFGRPTADEFRQAFINQNLSGRASVTAAFHAGACPTSSARAKAAPVRPAAAARYPAPLPRSCPRAPAAGRLRAGRSPYTALGVFAERVRRTALDRRRWQKLIARIPVSRVQAAGFATPEHLLAELLGCQARRLAKVRAPTSRYRTLLGASVSLLREAAEDTRFHGEVAGTPGAAAASAQARDQRRRADVTLKTTEVGAAVDDEIVHYCRERHQRCDGFGL